MQRALLLVVMTVMTTAAAIAQITVNGTVKDASGEGLIGASVQITGSKTGTVTDFDGNFTLTNVPAGATITVSYIGFTTQTLPATAQMDIVMSDDNSMLDEVVVVGYGATKKSNITGAIETVKIDELPQAGDASLGSMLRGRSAGMNITQNSATPGGSLNISIRGGLSGAQPLIVIDGVPQAPASNISSGTAYGGATKDKGLINLNPNDIEKIDVLKDAAAASIYGSDASGGVILITTKRGKEGKPSITYSGNVAFQFISDRPKFLNAKDFMQTMNDVLDELGRGDEKRYTQEQIDAFSGKGTDWLKEVTRTGVVQEHNVSLNGGTETTKYLTSLSMYDYKGIAKNSDMRRFTARVNLDQQLGKYFKVGLNSTFAHIKYRDVPLGDGRNDNSALIYSAMTFMPTVSVRDADGVFSVNTIRDIYPNPVSLLDVDDNTTNRDLNLSGYLEVKPFADLTVRATVGFDMMDNQQDQYIPTTTKKGFAANGIGSKQNAKSQMNLVNVVANYAKVVGVHDISAMVGWEYKKSSWNGMGIVAENFPYDGALANNIGISSMENPNISSYKGSSEMASFIGRLNYSLMSKYVATFNIRVDGSSNFSDKHQWAAFPGVSLAWRANEEAFLKNVRWLSNLKVRLGFGQTGNAGSLTGINTYYSVSRGSFSPGGTLVNGIRLSNLGNDDLKWETLTDLNLGFDLGFLKNKITATIDIYQRTRKDVIMQKSLMSYQEVQTIDYNSKARYRSTGVDVGIHTVNFDTKNFGWNTDISFSYYRNKTIERDPDETIPLYEDIKKDWGDVYGYRTAGIMGVGDSYAHLANSRAGSIYYLDQNGYQLDASGEQVRDSFGRLVRVAGADGVLDEADMIKLFNNTPIPFSINNSFRWKNWDANIYLYGSLHGYKLNDVLYQSVFGLSDITYGVNAMESVKNRWTYSNQGGTLPGVSEANSGIDPANSDFFYEKSWYLRLDNVSIGYTLPCEKWSRNVLKSIRFYVSGRNLYVFTPYKGMDPETGNGIGAYPNQKSVAFGVDVKF